MFKLLARFPNCCCLRGVSWGREGGGGPRESLNPGRSVVHSGCFWGIIFTVQTDDIFGDRLQLCRQILVDLKLTSFILGSLRVKNLSLGARDIPQSLWEKSLQREYVIVGHVYEKEHEVPKCRTVRINQRLSPMIDFCDA